MFIFLVAPLGHTNIYRNIDNLFTNETYASLFVIKPNNTIFKKYRVK